MAVNKGQNQTVVRDNNMKLILTSLLEKDMSCSDLADRLKLSKPALTKITVQMMNLGLITTCKPNQTLHSNALGRKKINIAINNQNGVVAGIDFSSVNIKLAVYTLKGEHVVSKELVDFEFINEEILQIIANTLAQMLRGEEVHGRELLCLCIGASGKIDKHTGEIKESKKFYQCQHVNLKEFFTEKFCVHVSVKNDIDLSIWAEKKYGLLRGDKNNAILIYIDSGLGGAILSDGAVFMGEHGFAGEFGLLTTIDDDGEQKPYDCITSINAIKDKIKEYQKKTDDIIFDGKFRFKDVVNKFFEGNEVVKTIVFRSAQMIGRLITNLVDILDCKYVILSGRIRKLNSQYLNEVRKNIESKNGTIEVMFSEIEGEGIMKGAISFAIDHAFDILIERRKLDRE